MNIGRLDRRVTFVNPVYAIGTSNEDKIIGWETIDNNNTVWAQKIERSGQTLVDQDRVKFVQVTTWMVRFREDLNIRMRLVFDTQVYEIVNISEADKGRDRYLKIETSLIDNEYFT